MKTTQPLLKLIPAVIFLAAGLAACSSGGPKGQAIASQKYVLGVNGYLWRATLDTLAFMPMVKADGEGGVVLTDWYVNPDTPNERMKVSAFILDRALSADSLTINVFREVKQDGVWVSAPVRAGTVDQLKDAVLNRARALRMGSTS